MLNPSLALFVALTAGASPTATGGAGAPLFDDLGDHHFAISSEDPLTQRYFDQGLTLVYAFNHGEAIRSFEEAARRDPTCAICWWGVALAYGPNINRPMPDEDVPKAWAALRKAQSLSTHANERERAYIEALAPRYAPEPVADRAPLDLAFAASMKALAERYRDDLDAATLAAEAFMDTTPWYYWEADGTPRPGTAALLEELERVLDADPTHPGANHYYIHAVEASPEPERGLAAARRLGDLVPGAGHLVHMPAHIYLRLGMYREATLANEAAARADERYIAQCDAQGFYPALYYSHNVHFLWYSLTMEGRRAEALAAAKKTGEVLHQHAMHGMAFQRWLSAVPLMGLVRFGAWDEILRAPRPHAHHGADAIDVHYQTLMWRFARGMALERTGKRADAMRELLALQRLSTAPETAGLDAPDFPGTVLVRIARRILEAEVLRGVDERQRIQRLTEAAAIEDALPYMEPPFWYVPVRHLLGAALLEAGRYEEAEARYREDLRKHPHNGWALFGLWKSLEGRGPAHAEAAAEARARFEKAWSGADFMLETTGV